MPRRIGVEVLPGCLHRISGAELRRIARTTMDSEGLEPEIELDVVLADVKTIQDLNRQYHEHDEPTSVITFPNAPDEIWTWPDEPPSLGEVVVSAGENRPVDDDDERNVQVSIARSLVHGVLEMIGYDETSSESDKTQMLSRQEAILAGLGYA